MRILLILSILLVSISIVHPKTNKEMLTCFEEFKNATLQVIGTAHSTHCVNCLNKCSKVDEATGIFHGFTEDCVNNCHCPGVSASVQATVLNDNCKSAFKLISFTGIMLVLLMSLLI